MSSGLDLAYEQAWASFETVQNRVVALSTGACCEYRLAGYAEAIKPMPIGADNDHYLGMGNNKDTSMEQITRGMVTISVLTKFPQCVCGKIGIPR